MSGSIDPGNVEGYSERDINSGEYTANDSVTITMSVDSIERDSGVTVAMLTRNAGPLLKRVLDSIRSQATERQVEVLAVDSGSSDGTLDVLEDGGVRVLTIPGEDFDFGRARDFAYQHTHTPVVINLSQDAVPAEPTWLENLIRPLQDSKVGVSCGSSSPDPGRDLAQFPWERNGYFYFTREIRKFRARYGKGVSFANSAVRRATWERLRFDPQPLAEDFQFQMKLHAEGLEAAFPGDAAVLHHHNYDLRALFVRCRNEGLSLRKLGCPYNEFDLIRDLASGRKYIQWLRELRRGSLTTGAAIAFPVVRPVAVYAGSRFGHRLAAYVPMELRQRTRRGERTGG